MKQIEKNQTIEFYISKLILIYLLLPLTLIFTWINIYFKGLSDKDLYQVLIFSILLPLAFISRIKALVFFFSNRPALILTENSIIDVIKDLNILWSDVSDIKIKIGRGSFLLIKLKD
jgi:hypothetical protein